MDKKQKAMQILSIGKYDFDILSHFYNFKRSKQNGK